MPVFITSIDVEVKFNDKGIVPDPIEHICISLSKILVMSQLMITGANTDCASNLHFFQVAV